MKRQELLKSPEYWMVKIQSELYSQIGEYIESEKINKSELAKRLNVSKGYISQVLNGDYDHRLSKFVELSLAVNKVPIVEFMDLDDVIQQESGEYVDSPLILKKGGLNWKSHEYASDEGSFKLSEDIDSNYSVVHYDSVVNEN